MMDLYVLNQDYKFSGDIFDDYQSLIWTERFDSLGDFELVIADSFRVREVLREGTLLSIDHSLRIMVVENIHEMSGDGGVEFKITGPSFESIMANRVGHTEFTGSTKTLLNTLVRESMIEGRFDSLDKLYNLKRGTNVLYPTSTIPPALERTPEDLSGWTDILSAHEGSASQSSLGFRIVRDPKNFDVNTNEGLLYYDNYTGNDLSLTDKTPTWSETNQSFENGLFYEVDRDVDVWENLCANPGAQGVWSTMQNQVDGSRRLFREEDESTVRDNYGGETSTVDCDWSVSGKCWEVKIWDPREEDPEPTLFSAYQTMLVQTPIADSFDGRSMYGKTITISAKIEIETPQTNVATNSGQAQPRCIAIRLQNTNAGGGIAWRWAESTPAPNTVGVHDVSLTFTFPESNNTQGYNVWSFRLTNGSTTIDSFVRWGDLSIVEHPSNPPGYFDGSYSPDTDLLPVWDGEPYKSQSRLTGKSIQGVESTTGCVFIQSEQVLESPISGRLINNTGRSDAGVTFRVENSTSRALIYRIIQTPPTQNINLSRLGTLQKGSLMGNTSPNVTGERLMYSGHGGGGVFLHAGFSDLGGSIWFRNLFVRRSTSTQMPDPIYKTPVIFSEDTDSFVVSESLRSIENYRNVAYVVHGKDIVGVVDDGYSGDVVGRRVMWVDGNDIERNSPDFYDRVLELGRSELKKNRRDILIDGEIPEYSRHEYDKDYSLGDLVLVENRSGVRLPMRVTEQIFSKSAEGFKAFPTLSRDEAIAGGVWSSPEYNLAWELAEPLGEWDDQP